jgi:hypothetical protein
VWQQEPRRYGLSIVGKENVHGICGFDTPPYVVITLYEFRSLFCFFAGVFFPEVFLPAHNDINDLFHSSKTLGDMPCTVRKISRKKTDFSIVSH